MQDQDTKLWWYAEYWDIKKTKEEQQNVELTAFWIHSSSIVSLGLTTMQQQIHEASLKNLE